MTTITMIRHGNTYWNNEKRAQGHSNNPLSEIGKMQAKAVARRLACQRWDAIFSSDLLRAEQTANIISYEIKQPITAHDQRLREIYRGKIEGTTVEERIRKWGMDWHQLELEEESIQSVLNRGVDFVTEKANEYEDQNILIISHGFLIRQTLKGLMRGSETSNDLENTSVTVIRKKSYNWEYLLYNCVCYMKFLMKI